MKRLLVVLMSSALLLMVPGASLSASERAKTSWKSETEGSPIATIDGEWATSGEDLDRVEFDGVHLVGAKTTFEARWVSPWVTWTWSDPVEIMSEGELSYNHAVSGAIQLIEMVRTKKKGRSWSKWMKSRYSPRGTSGAVGWGSETVSIVVGKPPPERLRFEWRLVGEVQGVSHLEGWAEVGLSR